MSRPMLALAATVAMALPLVPAMAEDSSITVTGPAMGRAGQPADGVNQRKRLVTNVTVDFADLDLRSDYGRWVLDRRVRIAADAACDRIDSLDPPSAAGGADDCRSLAMRRAEPLIRRAIIAAG